jgi:hypothetical protein
MGQSDSKQDILNNTLNEVTTDVMSKFSAAQSGTIDQTLNLSARKGGTIKGMKFENIASMNLSLLADAKVNGAMQNEITSKLDAALKANQDAIGVAASDAKIHNIVKNKVAANLNSEVLLAQEFKIKQAINAEAVGSDSEMRDSIATNKADVVAKMVNNISAGIISEMKADTTAAGKAESTQSNPLSTAVGAVKDLGLKVADTVRDISKQAISSWANIAIVFIIMVCLVVAYMGPDFIPGILTAVNPLKSSPSK